MKRALSLGAAALLAAGLFAGCGGSSGDSSGATDTTIDYCSYAQLHTGDVDTASAACNQQIEEHIHSGGK